VVLLVDFLKAMVSEESVKGINTVLGVVVMVATPVPSVRGIVEVTEEDRIFFVLKFDKTTNLVGPPGLGAGVKVGVDHRKVVVRVFVSEGTVGDVTGINDRFHHPVVTVHAFGPDGDNTTAHGILRRGKKIIIGEDRTELVDVPITWKSQVL
jgi:hypothetical protein